MTLPTGTVTFLFTDIEGSTQMLSRAGERYADLASAHAHLLTSAFERNSGQVVDTQGDSFFAAFASATHALQAAVDAQRALAAHDWPDEMELRVRMGVHTGEANLVGDHYIGMEVHRAARIAAAAHGGQIVVSEATAGLSAEDLPEGTRLRDLGEHRFKDLVNPQRIFQLDAEGLLSEFPALAALDVHAPSGRLPLTTFIGREREISQVAGLLRTEDTRLVTLIGPGGVGKTRLALAAAETLLSDFINGSVIILLADAPPTTTIAPIILRDLRVPEVAGRSALETLVEYLRPRQVLLVLDNFEHVIEAAHEVDVILRECPRVKVLVTSRQVLDLAAEQSFPVHPLDVTEPSGSDSARSSEAVQLFLARARSLQPDFEPSDDEIAAIVEIVRLVDGLPLAIELAAARTRLLTPQDIERRLRESLDLLKGSSRDLPERQRTIAAAIDWSYRLLDADESALARRLAVFEGGWALSTVEEMFDSDVDDVLDVISSLVDKSLVLRRPSGRLSMLRVIREFGLQRLEEAGEIDRVRDAHADYFISYAEKAGAALRTREQALWIEGLRADYGNVRAAINRSIARGKGDDVVRLAWALWIYWWVAGQFEEPTEWLEGALDTELSAADEGRARVVLGVLAFGRGELGRAARELEAGLRLCESHDEPWGAGLALSMLGLVVGLTDPTRGRQLIERAIGNFASAGDEWGVGFGKLTLGRVLVNAQDHLEAHGILTEAVRSLRRVGEESLLALSLLNLGWAQEGLGRASEAVPVFIEALEIFHRVDDHQGMSRVLEALARNALDAEDAERSALLMGAAERARREVGAEVWVPDRERHEHTLDGLSQALEKEALASLRNDGRTLTSGRALEIARDLLAAHPA
jgi:predicted ATPase/class 3 adenylate cyclase